MPLLVVLLHREGLRVPEVRPCSPRGARIPALGMERIQHGPSHPSAPPSSFPWEGEGTVGRPELSLTGITPVPRGFPAVPDSRKELRPG